MHALRTPALLAAVLALTAGCATSGGRNAAALEPPVSSSSGGTPAAELRLGYFPNVTHATAVYGDAAGTFSEALGDTDLTTSQFHAGPAAVEALFAGALDAAYLGPGPAINAFVKSRGEAVRVIAGATSGGASLVVRPGIDDVEDLRGQRIATPQTGSTQDVALRSYLADHDYEVELNGAGEVTVVAQDNPVTLAAFSAGDIDGAWVPEPWASRLVLEGGGEVLVDEADLWPGGEFTTTSLVVRADYLRDHPQTVKALIEGSVEANRQLHENPESARAVVGEALTELTGQALPAPVLERAFAQIEPTDDPVASSLASTARHAVEAGLLAEADLRGIYDLTLLGEVLGTTVDDAGLGGTP